MPAIATVALDVAGTALTTTANTVLGTSGTLTNGNTYLVLGQGNASTTSGSGTDVDGEFHIGGTAFARLASEHGPFSPSASLDSVANGGLHHFGLACTYTAGASDTMQYQAWGGAASGEGSGHFFALDMSDLTLNSDRWHQETANSDTIVTTPTSGYTVVGTALTFTAPSAGDYIIIASAELVANGTAAATDEFDVHLVIDGTEVDGTVDQRNVGGRTDTILGYFVMTVQTLTAASHTFQVEVNGTSSNGNIGARRIRIHAIRVGAIEGSDVQEVQDAAETVTGTATADVASTTIGNGSADYLIYSRAPKQVTFWSQGFHYLNSVETPTDGFGTGLSDFGVGAANDMGLETGLSIASAPASSTSLALRYDRVGGAGSNLYGTDCARAADGPASLIAIRLATPSADQTVTPSAFRGRWTVPAPAVSLGTVTAAPAAVRGRWTTLAPAVALGAVTRPPAAVRGRWTSPAPTVDPGTVTQAPAVFRGRFTAPAPTVVLGDVTAVPAALRGRYTAPAPSVVLGSVTDSPATVRGRWNVPAAAVLLAGAPITLTPAATRGRFTVLAPTLESLTPAVAARGRFVVPAPTITLGAVTVAPAAVRGRWAIPLPVVIGGASLITPPYGMTVAPDLAMGMTVAAGPSFGMTIHED